MTGPADSRTANALKSQELNKLFWVNVKVIGWNIQKGWM